VTGQNGIITFPGGRCLFAGRHGGASGGLYDSLNASLHVGDAIELVRENRRRLRERLGAARLLSARQVHGANIFSLTETLASDREIADCDALITNQPGVALMIQHADCQPVLLYDGKRRVIAAVHNGWRGSVAGILAVTVARMASDWHCQPADLHALIGPSLGPCCGEFIGYQEKLPREFQRFMPAANHFDFWRISRWQLMAAGLPAENISLLATCSRCDDNYFSHRRATATGLLATGRNAALIMLDED
jgi:YfiH family protein